MQDTPSHDELKDMHNQGFIPAGFDLEIKRTGPVNPTPQPEWPDVIGSGGPSPAEEKILGFTPAENLGMKELAQDRAGQPAEYFSDSKQQVRHLIDSFIGTLKGMKKNLNKSEVVVELYNMTDSSNEERRLVGSAIDHANEHIDLACMSLINIRAIVRH